VKPAIDFKTAFCKACIPLLTDRCFLCLPVFNIFLFTPLQNPIAGRIVLENLIFSRMIRMNVNILFFIAIAWVVPFMAGCQLQDEKGQSPISQLIVKLLPENSDSKHQKMLKNLSSPDPDLRREGIMAIHKSPIRDLPATRDVLDIMARGDLNPQVRAAALETLGQINPNHEKMPALLDAALKDDSPLVRRQAVAIMALRNDPVDMDRLLDRLATDTDAAIRADTADILGAIPHRRVLRALINHLEDDFSVAYHARRSLQKLTGQDFDYDTARWITWLSETADPFSPAATSSGS
jgi:hypothetical protein